MMGDATRVDPRTAASAHAPDTPPPPTQEVTLADDTEEIYSSATTNNKRPEEYDFSAIQRSRIPRFPHYLIGMGGADRRYVLPSVVAIGPLPPRPASPARDGGVQEGVGEQVLRALWHLI